MTLLSTAMYDRLKMYDALSSVPCLLLKISLKSFHKCELNNCIHGVHQHQGDSESHFKVRIVIHLFKVKVE